MQIILQEDIDKLGHRGDVVTVKPGYARNYLLPRKLAVEASAGNLKAIERIRTSLAKKTATELEAGQKQAELLNGAALKFTRKTGENDQMFGSDNRGHRGRARRARIQDRQAPGAARGTHQGHRRVASDHQGVPRRYRADQSQRRKRRIIRRLLDCICSGGSLAPRFSRSATKFQQGTIIRALFLCKKVFRDFRSLAQLYTKWPVDLRGISLHNPNTRLIDRE